MASVFQKNLTNMQLQQGKARGAKSEEGKPKRLARAGDFVLQYWAKDKAKQRSSGKGPPITWAATSTEPSRGPVLPEDAALDAAGPPLA